MDTELNRMGQFLQGLGTGAIDFGLRLLSALVVLAVCVAAMRVIRRLLKKVLTLKISPRAIPPARIESLTAFVLALYDVVAWFVIAMVTISKISVNEDIRLVIFDEPTALLENEKVDMLFRFIGELKSQGVSIIYISHRLEEIMQIEY